MSMFWGDPGTFHAWGFFRWWHELFKDPLVAYNVSIILLLWALSISQFIFVRKALPNLGRMSSMLLAPIIVFGSLRNEFLFNRPWISLAIFTGPISLVLYEFFRKPLVKHYFIYTLLLFLICAIGNTSALLQVIIISVAIFTAFIIYNHLQGNIIQPLSLFRNFFVLNLVSGISIIFLLGWTTYGLIIESQLVGYVRDPDYTPDSFFAYPSILFALSQISRFLQAGLFSHWLEPLGLQFLPTCGLNNVSPIFPFILLIFIFHKSKHFWEFTAKFIVLSLLIWQLLVTLVPGIIGILQSILHSYPLIKFQPVIQVYEIIILGAVIQKLQEENLKTIIPRWIFLKNFSIFLMLPYVGLFLISFFIVFFPDLLLNGLQATWMVVSSFFRSGAVLELAPILIKENVALLHEVMGWETLLFYGSTFFFFLLFSINKWHSFIKIQRGRLFCLFVLANSILLSWTAYPMNKEPLIWDRQELKQASPPIVIKNSDRIATVGSESCYSAKDKIECIKLKYLGEFGPKRYVVGYRLTPGLDFSAAKSFTPKKVALLITSFLEIDGLNAPGVLRFLQLLPAKFSSRLFDFVGVKYIMFPFPLSPSENLKLIYSSFQFYLYRNLSAWPTYYLANRIETIHEMKELYHAEKGVAYLWERDSKSITMNKSGLGQRGEFEINRFQFGDIEFHSSSKRKEFLVFMDAWHPNWRAYVDGNETKIIETNGVFKGVLLPPGDHTIHFFFDNKPYRPGIWISVIAWILFIGAWFGLTRREYKLKRAEEI